MAEFRHVRTVTTQGTPATKLYPIIKQHCSISHGPAERLFRPNWKEELKTRILLGHAIAFNWAYVHVGGTEEDSRVNGQNSGVVLGELVKDGTLPDGLVIHQDFYEADDWDGAILLFRQFDPRLGARTKTDISGAYQGLHPDLRSCDRGNAQKVVEAVNWYRRVIEELPVPSGDDVYQTFNNRSIHGFILLADKFLSRTTQELKRKAVLAAAYGSWLEDAKTAEQFWPLVALGSNRNREDAAMQLDMELIRLKDERVKTKDIEYFAMCHRAWECFKEGVPVTSFKVNTKKGYPKFAA